MGIFTTNCRPQMAATTKRSSARWSPSIWIAPQILAGEVRGRPFHERRPRQCHEAPRVESACPEEFTSWHWTRVGPRSNSARATVHGWVHHLVSKCDHPMPPRRAGRLRALARQMNRFRTPPRAPDPLRIGQVWNGKVRGKLDDSGLRVVVHLRVLSRHQTGGSESTRASSACACETGRGRDRRSRGRNGLGFQRGSGASCRQRCRNAARCKGCNS